MKRIVRPWKPLACCIATLCHLATPLLVSAQQGSVVQTLETNPENADPVIDDPIFNVDEANSTKNIEPKIPVGKTLLIPVSATDADGDPLSYKVSSNDPKVMVRVRTGRPHLKMNVDYAGTTGTNGTDPSFSGTLDFQLFRDWTPVTAGFIGGFAQSAFYSPRVSGDTTKHTIFHRVIKDFMVQGGDPNGQSASATERGPGFSFENEFDIPLIFSGRGQLAMANAGSDYNTYAGSNGSQFFITTSSPRFLDVKHTIFGQLTHGWDILEKMRNVPVQDQPIPPGSPAGFEPEKNSRPKSEIKITNTSLQPNFTDALLVLSATGKTNSPATITIQVTDSKGGTATKQFQVTAVQDEFNTPPFFTKLPDNQVTPLNKITSIPVRAIDLEQDFFLYENRLLPRYFPRGDSNRSGTPMLVLPSSTSPGPMTLGFWPRQLEMSINSFGSDENQIPLSGDRDRRSIQLAVNDYALKAEGIPLSGKPNETLTSIPVASYTDMDPRGQAGGLNSISINWGDGTPVSTGLVARDTSSPTIGAYKIVGSHSYARPGVYPVVTTLQNTATGLKQLVYSTAVITSGSLQVFGQKLEVKDRVFSGKPLATFKDLAANTTAADYEATLDWGDGVVTTGNIKQNKAGELYITGNHSYQDPETFSVAIRLHKKNTDSANDAYGWATLDMKGFQPAQQHLPPFPMGHMVGLINPIVKGNTQKPIRTTVGAGDAGQTTFSVSLSILNSGDKAVNPSKIRFYLSSDDRLNLEPETYMDGPEGQQVQRTNPKDIPLTIGKKQKELSIIALKPGQGGSITFDQTKSGDTRLYAPKGEDGTGYYLLAAFVYDDPMAKQLPIDTEVATDVAPVFTVTPTTLEVTEFAGAKHTQEFKVRFNRRPKHDVAIKMTIVGSDGKPDTKEAYFNAALPVPPQDQPNLPPEKNLVSSPDYTLVYTKEMWDANQKEIAIKVTGKEDNDSPVADSTVYVQLEASVSDDPIYHGRNLGVVRVVNRELNSFIQVDPLTLTTTEAAGTSHTKTFTVKLMQKPTKNVVVPVVVSDPAEGTVTGEVINGQNTLTVINGKPSLTFTPSETYPVTRTLTLTSIDDNEADGDAAYKITVGPSVSEDPTKDPAFNGLTPPEISVTNTDNPPSTPSNP